jgi:hypothetical protein
MAGAAPPTSGVDARASNDGRRMNAPRRNGLDVAAIHPDNGAKLSPNLYRWLTAGSGRRARECLSRVFRDPRGTLWIGYPDDVSGFIGQNLMRVLSYGPKTDCSCWGNLGALKEVPEFWPRYVRDGRCAIDVEHVMAFLADEGRWTVKGDARSCTWCGSASQVLRRWTEPVQREQWVMTAAFPARGAGKGSLSSGA